MLVVKFTAKLSAPFYDQDPLEGNLHESIQT